MQQSLVTTDVESIGFMLLNVFVTAVTGVCFVYPFVV